MSKVWEHIKQASLKVKLIAGFCLVLITAMIFSWYTPEPAVTTPGFNTAPPIAGTAGPKVDVTLPSGKVKVIPKGKLDTAVNPLPAAIHEDDNEVTATAEVPPSENGTQVLAVLKKSTGETTILTKENQPDFFAVESKKRIGVGYGYGSEGSHAKAFGEYTFLRIGSFHIGVQGEIEAATSKSPEAKALAIVDYRW